MEKFVLNAAFCLLIYFVLKFIVYRINLFHVSSQRVPFQIHFIEAILVVIASFASQLVAHYFEPTLQYSYAWLTGNVVYRPVDVDILTTPF